MALSKCDASLDPLYPIFNGTICNHSLAKKPSTIIIQVGTSDAGIMGGALKTKS